MNTCVRMYVNYAWAHMPMHTCRRKSMGNLVSMSVYMNMCRCMCLCLDMYMCVNMIVSCTFICAHLYVQRYEHTVSVELRYMN